MNFLTLFFISSTRFRAFWTVFFLSKTFLLITWYKRLMIIKILQICSHTHSVSFSAPSRGHLHFNHQTYLQPAAQLNCLRRGHQGSQPDGFNLMEMAIASQSGSSFCCNELSSIPFFIRSHIASRVYVVAGDVCFLTSKWTSANAFQFFFFLFFSLFVIKSNGWRFGFYNSLACQPIQYVFMDI